MIDIEFAGPGYMPSRAYPNDAGHDLFVWETMSIEPGITYDVDCGIAVAFPEGWYGRIIGRSSTLRKRGLLVVEGIIDEGYRGPLFVCARNVSTMGVQLLSGERIGQLLLHQTPPEVHWTRKPVLDTQGGRGEAGFGSSGR